MPNLKTPVNRGSPLCSLCFAGYLAVQAYNGSEAGDAAAKVAASHGILASEQILSAVTFVRVSITQLYLLNKTNGLH
jgi:hypothetical protein